MRSANAELRDRAIRHAVYLERLKAHEAGEVASFLARDVMPDVLERLRSALGRGLSNEGRLAELAQSMLQTLRVGLRAAGEFAQRNLVQVAITEAEWQRAIVQQSIPMLDVSLREPAVNVLTTIARSRPLEGKVLQDWFQDVAVGTARKITRDVKVGLATGDPIDDIVRRIKGSPSVFESAFGGEGTLQQANRACRSVVRTAVAQVTSDAREETFKANGDVISSIQIVATLDMRTTDICRAQDGKVYPVNSGPRPPFHFGCRTVTVPVTKSWKELGLSLKGKPEASRSAQRASMDGEVAATVTYPEWLRGQPREVQDDVLGRTRADLFRSGRISIERFVDSQGRRLSLKALRRREGL